MISRLEAGYSAEAVGDVDLADAVRDVVELYEPAADEVGVSLEADRAGTFVVDGNRELIGQALSNIVDNAIKYSAREPACRSNAARAGRAGAGGGRDQPVGQPTMVRAFPTKPTASAPPSVSCGWSRAARSRARASA